MEELKEIMSTCKDFFFAGFKAANSCKNEEDEKEKEHEAKNEDTDKRKLIDEVAGIMKSGGCDDELIRTAIGKMEKLSYDKSSAGTANNKAAKNNEDEEAKKEEEKKKAEEEAKNKAKNEEEKKKQEEYEELKKETEEEALNKAKNALYGSDPALQPVYITREDRLQAGLKY